MQSLGLSAYRANARQGDARLPDFPCARPEGELLWIHCPEADAFLAIQDLAQRQIAIRPNLSVLITVAPSTRGTEWQAETQPDGIILARIGDDHPDVVSAFVGHWAPDCCVWAWGGLRPNLLLKVAETNCPLFLIDADVSGFNSKRERWLPGVVRSLLPLFMAVFTRTPAAATRLIELGLSREDVEVTTSLQASGAVLPCNESDLADLSATCVGRSIWFANGVQREELNTVLAAHRQALRFSHRLLLVLRPAGTLDLDESIALTREQNFRVLSWDDGHFPDEATQVLITQDVREAGLFYRIAPVSFLGGSLVAGQEGVDPLEAAALGSAILYGPRVGRNLNSYSRLATAGAARIINDSAALGMAISRLTAPDQAAVMAHAGWDTVSAGAALTDRITDRVQDALDIKAGIG